jgi:hypothetical protein
MSQQRLALSLQRKKERLERISAKCWAIEKGKLPLGAILPV